jgi:Domain of unknown function (DUF4357)
MTQPYSIKIFLPNGDPDGLRTIEKSNWSGSGIVVPRALLAAAKSRRELSRTGVYVLVGPPEDSGLPRVYVGEGDPIKPRLDQHAAKKDFWTICIAFTSKDDNLNKAHVQFIESRLVALANAAKRCVLDNGNAPALPSLSEADAAEAAGFLTEMMLCFPVLGLSVFAGAAPLQPDLDRLHLKKAGLHAQGLEVPDGFVVLQGSQAVVKDATSLPPSIAGLRAALVGNGVLERVGDIYAFTQDYVFSSPSTAAGVVQGRSANGRVDWKTSAGATLKERQERMTSD